uniref:Uncharacterized protein n=1 Tax=Buteo japonicus TaxID=224669 RepID=A0A8C0C4I3_9AVES
MTIASWEVLVMLQQKQETSLLYSFKYIGLETAYSSKDPPDKLLMVLGTTMAILHGAGVSLMMIIFGDMTDISIKFPSFPFSFSLSFKLIPFPILLFPFRYAYYYPDIRAGVLFAALHSSFILAAEFFHAVMTQEIRWFDKHDEALTKCTASKEFISVFSTHSYLFGYNLVFSVTSPRLMKK